MFVVESLSDSECSGNYRYVYYYRMVRSSLKLALKGGMLEIQSYGIEVEKQSVVDDKIVDIERDCIKNISPERHKVHNLLKLLCDNKVSPVHLVDIIGSFVDDYISDFDMPNKETATI